MRVRLVSYVMFAALFGLVNCKKTDQSETKSLDNFAAGKHVKTNTCGVKKIRHTLDSRWSSSDKIKFGNDVKELIPGVDQSEAGKNAIAKVKQYLTALHPEVQKFFLNDGGQIILTGKAKQDCNVVFADPKSPYYIADASRRDAESCVIKLQDPNGSGNSILALYHQVYFDGSGQIDQDKTNQNIMHTGVRLFGLEYASRISRLVRNDNAAERSKGKLFVQVPNDNIKMSALKSQLTSRFLVDLVESQDSRFKIENMASYLGQDVVQSVKSRLLQGASGNKVSASIKQQIESQSLDLLDLASLDKERKANFENFVFGESFDSFNCSDESLAIMDKHFNYTYQGFVSVNETINSVSRMLNQELIYASQGTGSQVAGFGLAETLDRPSEQFAFTEGGLGNLLQIFSSLFSGGGMGDLLNFAGTSNLDGASTLSDFASQANQQLPSFANGYSDLVSNGASTSNCNCADCQGGSCSCAGGYCNGSCSMSAG